MKTSIQILPGIKSIGWVDCSFLPENIALCAICDMSIALICLVHNIDFFGDPTCECTTKKEAGSIQQTVSLKFSSNQDLPRGIDFGFVIVDTNNQKYLIGTKEPPYTSIEIQKSTGTPSGNNTSKNFEVKHCALRTLIPCQ